MQFLHGEGDINAREGSWGKGIATDRHVLVVNVKVNVEMDCRGIDQSQSFQFEIDLC